MGEFPDEGEWLCGQMYLLVKKVDNCYHDNWRWCLIGNETTEKKYKEKLSGECCGFADEKVIHPKSKNVYKIGFNFGH